MTTLEAAVALARRDRVLVVISTLRSNGTIQASLVHAGVIRRLPFRHSAFSVATARRVVRSEPV